MVSLEVTVFVDYTTVDNSGDLEILSGLCAAPHFLAQKDKNLKAAEVNN